MCTDQYVYRSLMKAFEMVFQVTPWESHQELYFLNSKQSREMFFNQIVKKNQRNLDHLYASKSITLIEANFLKAVYIEINLQLDKMKHKFIETGEAIMDCHTYITVIEHDFADENIAA